jgi:hypothetical protein
LAFVSAYDAGGLIHNAPGAMVQVFTTVALTAVDSELLP